MQHEQDDENTSRWFKLALFIKHPTLDPKEITAALGLQPQNMHAVGAQRMTPTGKRLEGRYSDTRWRHSISCLSEDQLFVGPLVSLLDHLTTCSAFFDQLKASGAQAQLILQFTDPDHYFGDSIPANTLAKLAQLGLGLGIEVYRVPQTRR